MKNSNILAFAFAVFTLFAFTKIEKNSYTVDTKASALGWLAKKVTGQHDGSIQIKNGALDITNNQLVGGNFIIDMTTIKVLDIKDPDTNKKLLGHLNSKDFFAVDNYKEAKFVITSAKSKLSDKGNYSITGNLTIKGKTHPVTFPAKVDINGSNVTASAVITFDRSKYDVRYGSGSFFENLGDKTIYDEVDMNVKLVAKK